MRGLNMLSNYFKCNNFKMYVHFVKIHVNLSLNYDKIFIGIYTGNMENVNTVAQ